MKPRNGWLQVRRYERPDKTPSGRLFIPESYRTDYEGLLWEVLAVSDRVSRKGVRLPSAVRPGDLVLVGRKYATQDATIDIGEEPVYLVREEDVEAVIATA